MIVCMLHHQNMIMQIMINLLQIFAVAYEATQRVFEPSSKLFGPTKTEL